MQDTELLKYGKYLTSLIASVILKTTPPSPFKGIDWGKLYNLAKKHDVTPIIYSIVEHFDIPEEVSVLFKNSKNKVLARTTRQAIEADKVLRIFELNDIKYIRLKGLHIKEYYPAPYMRIFSDIDIYVNKTDREKAQSLMNDLGYELKCILDYHDEYEKDNFYIYEIHNPIVSEDIFYHEVFNNPFQNSLAVSGNKYNHVLNNEHFYLHLFFHLYQHFITRGCGIRLFTDLFVFQENIKNVDYDYIKSVLSKYDLMDFYNSVQKLISFFFTDKSTDKNTLKIAGFIFSCRANEAYNNNLANLGFWGKIKYFSKLWFPPAKELYFRYPVLEKAPVLLPVCWVRRICYSLFFNRSAIKIQFDNIKTINSKEYKSIKKARSLATKSK